MQITAAHAPLERASRRALHELELAGLDLRAAQGRRGVAVSQLEYARNGVLGIDFVAEHANAKAEV